MGKEFNKKAVDIQEKLQNKLGEHRYQHSLGVCYTAACLAMKYEIDVEKAILAGLLHDCAKYMSDNEMFNAAKKANIDITKAEEKVTSLLHAKLGAYYAKNKYGVDDDEILNAIICHTTGKPDMNMLEKIIFISDYIEPNRYKMPRLNEIRRIAFEDIDKCLIYILSDTIDYLKSTDAYLDDTTVKTYEFYK